MFPIFRQRPKFFSFRSLIKIPDTPGYPAFFTQSFRSELHIFPACRIDNCLASPCRTLEFSRIDHQHRHAFSFQLLSRLKGKRPGPFLPGVKIGLAVSEHHQSPGLFRILPFSASGLSRPSGSPWQEVSSSGLQISNGPCHQNPHFW